ncbi:MAG: hypothetical protein AB8B69_10265, partial [Chitinophagales bacterium]
QGNTPVWIEGATLTGKSRTVFEVLKQLPEGSFRLAKSLDLTPKVENLSPIEGQKTVVYIDDLLTYYQSHSHQTWMVNQWLSQLLEANHVQVVVSNRTGLEATLLADYLPNDLLQRFDKINIPSISFDDIEKFQMDADVRLDFNAFDDSMGSLLMGFSNVEKKYGQLEDIAELGWSFSQKVADTAQDILFTLKHLHHIGHFHKNPNCFDIALVKDFCLRLQGRKISQKQWQEALQLLEFFQQKTVSFMDLSDAKILKINTVYLDRAIETGLADSGIVRKIKELYTTIDQRIDNGFFLHPLYFSKRIYTQHFFEQAKQLLEQAVREGFQPNAAVFNSLLRKTSNFEEAFVLLQPMKEWKVKPDLIFFEVLLSKTSLYPQGSQVYAALKNAQVHPNLTFFNELMAKADSYQQVLDLVLDMEKMGVKPSTNTFNALIAQTEGYDQILQWRKKMEAANCSPNLQTFLYQLQQSSSFEEAQMVWQEMQTLDLQPSSMEYFHLYLRQTTELAQALSIKQQIEATTFSLDVLTFNILLQLSSDANQIQGFRNEMQLLEIAPNTKTFTTLISKATDFEAALKLLQEMPTFQLKASTSIYNALLQQAIDLEEAMTVFAEMHEQQIPLDEDSFLILLDKTTSFEEGLRLLIQLQQADYKAGKSTYNRLIARAETIQPALQALRKMRQNGTPPDAGTYTLLMGKVNEGNFKQAFNLFKAMKSEYVQPTEESYVALLEKVKGYEQAFVNQVLRLYPQTLTDVDYHRIFAAILPHIDRSEFLKIAEEYIERDEKIKVLYQ